MTGKHFLHVHKQDSSILNFDEIAKKFLRRMDEGLNGQCTAMPMIPTYITDVDRSSIKPNVKRILIDAGGTNFRAAVGYFDEQGKPRIENIRKTPMPASDGTYFSKEAFYSAIADGIKDYLDKADDVGFCFSYQVNMDKDVDGEVVMFSKEINAPEVIGTRVGRETLLACKRYSDKERGIVILNDTVATLLGGMATSRKKYSTYIGYIYGTGTNVCYIEDASNIKKVAYLPAGKMLINTECGNFDGFTLGDFDKACLARTAVPNRQLFEKMTSGKYLADIIAEAYKTAQAEGAFDGDAELRPFELKDVSSLLTDGQFPCKFACEKDLIFAKEIAVELINRAAQMGALVVAMTAVKSCREKDCSLPVAVVAEGTTFNKLPAYRKVFEEFLTRFLHDYGGLTYEIVQGEELNFVGSLMASMML